MDFSIMGRKDLQRLCKKHGIKANLKNIEMAEKLSLIYKEKENENRVSRRLRNVKDKLNAEIVVLDSDSDTEVQMEAPGTVGGNADLSEVKSASSQQMSRGQEESQMKLQGTAAGHVDACEVISESLQMISQGLEESPMKFTPERRDNVRPFYAEENMEMSVNVLEQFGNYMMIGENSYATPIQFLPTSDLNIHKMVVKDTCEEGMLKLSEKTCIDADPEKCNGFSPDKLEASATKGFEAERYFDQTTHGDVMETYNRNESMVDKEHIEDNQELSPATPTDFDVHHIVDSGTAAGHADDCEVKSASLEGREEAKKNLTPESSDNVGTFDVDGKMHVSVNKEEIEENLELHQAAPCEDAKVLEEFGNNLMMVEDSDGTPVQFLPTSDLNFQEIVADPEDCIGFFDNCDVGGVGEEIENESYTVSTKRKRTDVVDTKSDEDADENMHVSVNKEQIEENIELHQAEPCEDVKVLEEFGNSLMMVEDSDGTPGQFLPTSDLNIQEMVADPEDCIGFFDNCDVGGVGVEDENESYTASNKRKGSDVVDTNSDEDVDENKEQIEENLELNQAAPCEDVKVLEEFGNNMMMGEDLDGTPVQFLPTSDLTIQEMDADPEDCVGFFDNCDVGGVGVEEENESYTVSTKRKRTDVVDTNLDEEVKAGELVPTVSQPSEMMSCNFGLQQLFATDTCEEGMLKLSEKTCIVADPEKCIGFSPDKLEASITKGFEAETYFDQTTHGDVMETYNRKESMVDKEHIEDNQELSPAAPTDLDDHHMVDSDTASGDEDAYKTKLNSPPKGLPIASEEKTIIFSPKLDDSSMVHKETEIEMSFPLNHERDSIRTCEEEILKLSEKTCMDADTEDCIGFFDNSGVGGVGVEDENESYTASNKRKRSDVVDTNSDEDVKEDTCEEEMLELSEKEKTCMVADLEACIGFSPDKLEASTTKGFVAETYVDQTTPGDVMETYNGKEIMADKEHIENNQELSPATPTDLDVQNIVDSGTAAGHADECDVKSASLQGREEAKKKLTPERSGNVGTSDVDENMHVSVNKEQIEENLELQAAPCEDVTVLEEFGNNMMMGEDPDGAPVQFLPTSDLNIQEMVADPEDCIGFFDNCDVGGVGIKDENESYTFSTKRKRTDVVDANSDMEVKSGELVPTVSQPSEMMSCDFSLQQLFATDTCEEEMLKLPERETASMVADLEACIGSPNHLDAATVKISEADRYLDPNILGNVVMETCRTDKVEKQNNQEDCFSAQGEVSKFFDNSDVGADELVQTVPPQPSETESCDFSLRQLFASDIASEDKDAYQKKLDSPSMATPTSSGEKNMIVDESKMTFQCESSDKESNQMSVSKEQIEDHKELSSAPSEYNLELHHTAPREDVNVLEEFGNYMMVGEDSDGRPIQILPTSDHNIHKMVVRDTCEEEMLELSEKTCMVADPKEDCISALEEVRRFVEKSDVYDDIGGVGAVDENQPHMMSRKRKSSDEDDNIEMSFPQKRARDNSIGTCDMKENINIDKKEEVGSIMSKTKFAKRQPLQDLQQN